MERCGQHGSAPSLRSAAVLKRPRTLQNAVNQSGVEPGGEKIRMIEQAAEKRDIGLNSRHLVLAQSSPQAANRLGAVAPPDHQF